MTSAEWLEHLRSQQEHSHIFKWDPELDNLISSLPTSEQHKAREIWESRVGKTVGQILDDQFQAELQSIHLVLDDIDHKIISTTHFGLYLTNDCNAWAGYDPTGMSRVVVLHEGLPHTLIAWANCYVKSVELNCSTKDQALDIFRQTIRYMASVWNNTKHQHPWQRPSNVENAILSQELYNTALCFIVAHEIGHIRFGHKGYTSDMVSNHQMEFDADSHALKVATKFALTRSALYEDSWVYKFTLMAPLFVMSLLSLFGNTDSETHPSVSRRLEALASQHELVFRSICLDQSNSLIEFLDENLFDMLLRNSKNLLDLATTSADGENFSSPSSTHHLPPSFIRV